MSTSMFKQTETQGWHDRQFAQIKRQGAVIDSLKQGENKTSQGL